MLKDAEIPVVIFDEASISAMGYNVAIGGYRLAVHEHYVEEAKSILSDFLESIKEMPDTKVRCPKCHSELTTNRPTNLFKLLITLFITNILMRLSSPYYHCKRCKHSWNENKRK